MDLATWIDLDLAYLLIFGTHPDLRPASGDPGDGAVFVRSEVRDHRRSAVSRTGVSR